MALLILIIVVSNLSRKLPSIEEVAAKIKLQLWSLITGEEIITNMRHTNHLTPKLEFKKSAEFP